MVLRPTARASAGGPTRMMAARPLVAAKSINFMSIVRGASRWWRQGVAAWLVGSAALCAAIQFSLKPSYEASCLVRVEPTPQELFNVGLSSSNANTNYMETQAQLLTSSNVLLSAASDTQSPGLGAIRSMADPEAAIREMLDVKIQPKTYFIRVAATSRSPVEASSVVNAVVKSFLEADAEWSEGMTRSQIKNLEAYRTGLQPQVEGKQKIWLELAARGNAAVTPPLGEAGGGGAAPGPVSRMSVTLEEYRQVRGQLLRTQLELAEAEAVLEFQRAQAGPRGAADPRAGLDQQVAREFRQDPAVAKLLAEIQQLEDQLAKFHLRVSHQSDPAILMTKHKIEALRARYRKHWDERSPELRDRLAHDPKPAGSGPSRDKAREAAERVATLKANIETLKGTIASIEVADREHGSDSVKIALVQSDLKRLEEMEAVVDRRLEQLRFESRGQARVRRLSEARVPLRPISDKRPKLMAGAPAGLLALIVGLTMLMEVRAGRVGGPGDLAHVALEVFAIPPLPDLRPARSLARPRPTEHLVAEYVHRIDHVREALCGGIVPGMPGRCVVITSAVCGEGKTTLASQLAVRCANAGASTLLIDADLRRPSLARLFALPDGPGLVDVLKGEASIQDAIVQLAETGCRFLPAGRPEPNPARLILGRELGPLLEQLRRSFEVVIIDTPPVLPVPDALTLGRWADGAVLASRFDASRLRLVEQAQGLLLSTGIPVLGAVLNGVRPAKIYGHEYASNYSYGPDRPAGVEAD